MKKYPVLWAIIIGLAAAGLTVGLAQAMSSDTSQPLEITNLLIFAVIVGGVVGRCAFMGLEPREKAEPKRS